MRTLITGEVVDFVPTFNAHLDEKGLFLSEDGDFAITVDTGFNGGIAIPLEMLGEMDVEFFGYDTLALATGDIVELPMFMGKVILDDYESVTWFIPGDSLLGMAFLSAVGSILCFDFENETVELKR
ncbi:MAG: hypothetical protein EF813_09975 [Methanosarcinales archaeon]|nr:MAG: hypothetical protein EF813_09975 [Methanosarcinales archaeon]